MDTMYRTYKSLNRETIHPIPSVLDLRHLAGTVAEAEHVGIQSDIDLHEKAAYEKHQKQQEFKHRGGQKETTVETPTVYDPTTLLVAEDAPLRYDVDIVTKLIVYAGKKREKKASNCIGKRQYKGLLTSQLIIGIGFLAVCPVIMLFQFCGLSS